MYVLTAKAHRQKNRQTMKKWSCVSLPMQMTPKRKNLMFYGKCQHLRWMLVLQTETRRLDQRKWVWALMLAMSTISSQQSHHVQCWETHDRIWHLWHPPEDVNEMTSITGNFGLFFSISFLDHHQKLSSAVTWPRPSWLAGRWGYFLTPNKEKKKI